MVWRLSTKNIFLTYPRCDLPAQQALDSLVQLLSDYNPHIRVAREEHDDGGFHLHAFIRLERKLDTRRNNFFDLGGHHPNIQSCRNLQATFDYVSKDGEFVDFGSPSPEKQDKWKKILSSTTAEEFWTSANDLVPRDYVLNHEKLEYFVQKKFGEIQEPYTSPYPGFNIAQHPQLQDWVDSSLNQEVCLAVRLAPPAPHCVGGAIIC